MQMPFRLIAGLLFIVSACSPSIPSTLTPVPPTQTPEQLAATIDPLQDATLRVVGEEEVVYDWSQGQCGDEVIPDLPTRAYRDAEGNVHLLISHTETVLANGPDLNSVAIDCRVVSGSAHNADPALFSDNEWLAALYTEDGETVYALVHNEHHGHEHGGQCPASEYFPCWYNTVTLKTSSDGGGSFDYAAVPPGHFVAGLPVDYRPGGGPYGIFSPSNIVKGKDGYYYSFVKAMALGSHAQSVCLMRSNNLADPSSWRFWDGEAFNGIFVDPYVGDVDSAETCRAIAPAEIGAQMVESLTYNTYLEQYVLVGISADSIEGREVWGFYYSFSDDMVHWTQRKLLMEVPLPWTVTDPGSDLSLLYPSLLDPASSSLSFETTGKTAYLYFTRNNHGHSSLDRDLVRVAVEFFPDEENQE